MAWVDVAHAVTTGRHGPQALFLIAIFPAAILNATGNLDKGEHYDPNHFV